MLFVRRFRDPQEPATIDVDYFGYMGYQLKDSDDRAHRITRALRWLRRASLADDEIEEFAIMMMGLDGLKSLLPRPPVEGQGKKGGGGKKAVSKPGINATLKHWAVSSCGIAPENWRQVWDLRNDLFHGDITENADTRAKLRVAIPSLRLALGLALKHVLKLPEVAPPHLGFPPVVITNLQITAPPFTPAPDPSARASQQDASDPPDA